MISTCLLLYVFTSSTKFHFLRFFLQFSCFSFFFTICIFCENNIFSLLKWLTLKRHSIWEWFARIDFWNETDAWVLLNLAYIRFSVRCSIEILFEWSNTNSKGLFRLPFVLSLSLSSFLPANTTETNQIMFTICYNYWRLTNSLECSAHQKSGRMVCKAENEKKW